MSDMAFGQSIYDSDQLERLEELFDEVLLQDRARITRVEKFVKKNQISKSYIDNKVSYKLIDVEDNRPIYYCTHNTDAQLSTQTNSLKAESIFGISFSGVESRIGVWDSNMPLKTHAELDGKIVLRNSQIDITDHSTHVTCTIVGKGINSSAQGFCHDADIYVFDWDSDAVEMLREVIDSNLIVSNHSYGVPAGWESGGWRGDRSISDQEDARFGYYDNRAAQMDEIAYNAPYYTIVTSAGNERGESGTGTNIPADGPYDCMTGFTLGKNVLTVGAVQKLARPYSEPRDIVMSTFSSWGPTDDGRIKPDIVAPGVGVFSATSGSDNSYASFNGTSMAAPCVTGIVSLLQEANFYFKKEYLESATIKAILISTAMEAGKSDGPDYEYGWGMVNTEEASKLVIHQDNVNKIIIEDNLRQGESYRYPLNPVEGEPIKITMVWSDPAGIPVELSLDPEDLMLVNDLDIRLVNENGEEHLPWVLDPANPESSASKGDNFRDNVEQIDVINSTLGEWYIEISHKGELSGGSQDFSIVVDHTSQDPGVKTLYWIGGSGTWDDPNHWSLESNGVAAMRVPDSNTRVIIDQHSFNPSSGLINLLKDETIHSLITNNDKDVEIDLGGNKLILSNTISTTVNGLDFENGIVELGNPNTSESIHPFLEVSTFDQTTIQISEDNKARWNFFDQSLDLDILEINGGSVSFINTELSCNEFLVTPSALRVIFDNSSLEFSDLLSIDSNRRITNRNGSIMKIFPSSSAQLFLNNQALDFELEVSNASLTIDPNTLESSFEVIDVIDGSIDIQASFAAGIISIAGESNIIFSVDRTRLSTNELQLNNESNIVSFSENSGIDDTWIEVTGRNKYCHDFISILGVNLIGNSIVNLGNNSMISEATGWLQDECENILFSGFRSNYLCDGALAIFEDNSSGDILTREWFVDGEMISGDLIMEYVFEEEGTYMVTLEIVDTNGNKDTWTEEIEVDRNRLSPNTIIQNATELVSQRTAEAYQWYKNGVELEGETQRNYAYNGELGVYWVLTFDDDCNRRSEILDLSTSLDDLTESLIMVYPNPTTNVVYLVNNNKSSTKHASYEVFDLYGTLVMSGKNNTDMIDLSQLTEGSYFLRLENEKWSHTLKLLKL